MWIMRTVEVVLAIRMSVEKESCDCRFRLALKGNRRFGAPFADHTSPAAFPACLTDVALQDTSARAMTACI